MTVLSRPIVWLLYNTNTDSIRLGGRLLAALGASIVFYSLSTLSNSILQAVGKASKPVTNAVIALAVQTVVAAALLIFTDLGIYSLPIAVTVYSFYDVPVKWHRGEKKRPAIIRKSRRHLSCRWYPLRSWGLWLQVFIMG